MSNLKTCKKHIEKPIPIYNKCAACEMEMYREERNKYKKALEEIITLNKSIVGDYPVLKSDGEMFKIAKKALKDE